MTVKQYHVPTPAHHIASAPSESSFPIDIVWLQRALAGSPSLIRRTFYEATITQVSSISDRSAQDYTYAHQQLV